MKRLVIALVFVSTMLSANPFSKNNVSIGLLLGSASVVYQTGFRKDTQNYSLFGVSADYFVMDDLSVGLGYTGWFGGTPTINQLTLPVTYYIPVSEKIRPYLGAYLRQTMINSDTYDDYTSFGGRVGVAYLYTPRSYVGVGWVQDSEDDSHPEFVISFSF